MSKAASQARRDANNGKTGAVPSGYNQQQAQEYQKAFQDQKAKNSKR